MAKKKPYIETNIEKLAMYYFDLAGVSSLVDLQKSDYWIYFEQDKLNALRARKKREFETNEKTIIKKDLVFTCSNCKKELGYKVLNSFILDEIKFNFDWNTGFLNILCYCGKDNSFFIPKEKIYKELKDE